MSGHLGWSIQSCWCKRFGLVWWCHLENVTFRPWAWCAVKTSFWQFLRVFLRVLSIWISFSALQTSKDLNLKHFIGVYVYGELGKKIKKIEHQVFIGIQNFSRSSGILQFLCLLEASYINNNNKHWRPNKKASLS